MGHSSSLWTNSAGVSSGGHRCTLFGAQNPREPSSGEGVSREGSGPPSGNPSGRSHRRPAQVGVMCVLPKRRCLFGKKLGLKETSKSTLPMLTRTWRAGDGDFGCFLALHQEPQGRAPVLAQGLDPGALAPLEGLVHRHPFLKHGSCPPRAAERTFHAMSAGEPWGPWRASVALGALLDGSAGGRWWGHTELRTSSGSLPRHVWAGQAPGDVLYSDTMSLSALRGMGCRTPSFQVPSGRWGPSGKKF